MAGHKSITVVPATHLHSGCRQARILAVSLQQPVVVQRQIGSVDAIVLLLDKPPRQPYLSVVELLQRRVLDRLKRGQLRNSAGQYCRRGARHELPA